MGGRILVIDSVMPNRIILKVKLSGAGYEVLIAATGREGLDLALHERPDLIILDMDLPDMPAEEVMAKLQSVASLQNALVIMASASTDAATRIRAFHTGADDFFGKPFVEPRLLALIRSLLRGDEQLRLLSAQSGAQFAHDIANDGFAEPTASFTMLGTLAIVGKPEEAMRLRRKLPQDLEVEVVHFSPEVVINGANLPFDTADVVVILSDVADPNAALLMIATLLGRPQTRDARFCVQFNPESRGTDRELAYDFGADAILMDDDLPEELGLRLAGLIRRKRRTDALRDRITHGLMLSMKDPLTNIPNRRYMVSVMRSFITKARRSRSAVAVIICDVDRFKSVNDRFGHGVGDDVLREVAARLSTVLREGDLIARVGGEEFLVALPDATMGDARGVAERLVSAIAARPFVIEGTAQLVITISAGLAISQPDLATPVDEIIDNAIIEADKAMLVSKTLGRNKITLARSAA